MPPPGWPPSPQPCCSVRRAVISTIDEQHRRFEVSLRQATWHAGVSTCQPFSITRELSRADQVLLYRLQLDCHTQEELRDDFKGWQCGYCGHVAVNLLQHYLLSCTAEEGSGQRYTDSPQDEEATAALVVMQVLMDLPRLLGVLRASSPPR